MDTHTYIPHIHTHIHKHTYCSATWYLFMRVTDVSGLISGGAKFRDFRDCSLIGLGGLCWHNFGENRSF